MEKLIKSLRGGSLSNTSLISVKGRLMVRKTCAKEVSREYGLVRWHSQIRKLEILKYLLPNHVPELLELGELPEDYFFSLEYVPNSLDTYAALLQGLDESLLVEKIIELLSLFAQRSFPRPPGALVVYLSEEVVRPLIQARRFLEERDDFFSSATRAELMCLIERSFEAVNRLRLKYRNRCTYASLSHGNMTLENLVWDPLKERLLVIDPYGETYVESVLGDVSQLFQSTLSGYEQVDREPLFLDEQLGYPFQIIDKRLISLGEALKKNLSTTGWYDADICDILHASQFIRMFPFKSGKSPAKAFMFLAHGMRMILGDYND